MATDRTRPRNLTTGEKADGTTCLNKRGRNIELDYSPIKVSDGMVDHVRHLVAGNSEDADDARTILEHLGLMPEQSGWYKDGSDT